MPPKKKEEPKAGGAPPSEKPDVPKKDAANAGKDKPDDKKEKDKGLPPPPAEGPGASAPPPPPGPGGFVTVNPGMATENALRTGELPAYDATKHGMLLEEAEVLPYESVFEWDCQDPLGYYAEHEKHDKLMEQFENDEVKRAVVTGMWRDRLKYQILRRFQWPPTLMVFKKVFLSRGYYEDYEPRPGVDVATMMMLKNKKRNQSEAVARKGAENRTAVVIVDPNAGKGDGKDGMGATAPKIAPTVDKSAFASKLEKKKPKPIPPPVVTAQKRSLSDFDPLIYNRQILIIKGLPGDTKQKFLDDTFPTASIEMKPDGKGGFEAVCEFQSEADAADAFRKAMKMQIGGRPVNILPQLRLPDSNVGRTSRDEVMYANPYMVKQHLQMGAGKQTEAMAAIMNMNKPKDDKKKDAKVAPEAPKPKAKTTKKLNSYNPLEFDYFTLGINNIPQGTKKEDVEKLFPKGKVTEYSSAGGTMKAIVVYEGRDDAIAAYADQHEQLLNGREMDIIPEKVPEGGKKKKSIKPKAAPEPEIVEEVTYEVVHKDKKKKKSMKPKAAEAEVVEEVTYEVVPKDKAKKK